VGVVSRPGRGTLPDDDERGDEEFEEFPPVITGGLLKQELSGDLWGNDDVIPYDITMR
jgi:hypothetical protein